MWDLPEDTVLRFTIFKWNNSKFCPTRDLKTVKKKENSPYLKIYVFDKTKKWNFDKNRVYLMMVEFLR